MIRTEHSPQALTSKSTLPPPQSTEIERRATRRTVPTPGGEGRAVVSSS